MTQTRRTLIRTLALVCLGTLLPGGLPAADPAPQPTGQPEMALHFRSDRTFTIVQFTDTHWLQSSDQDHQIRNQLHGDMAAILDREKPDLIVLTGDLVTPRRKEEPLLEAWTEFTAPLGARGTPWIAVLGNHDGEGQDIPRTRILEHLESLPGSLCRRGPFDGSGDAILDIAASGGGAPAARLYCLYSGAYTGNTALLGKYAWITGERIQWYRRQAGEMAARNHGPLPALAFFHIPLPEYRAVRAGLHLGNASEWICDADVNSGMLAAMLESKDVMGVFTGHDHLNDFIGLRHGICLGYGRKTGSTFAAYGTPLSSGARIIVLREGERSFDTWIRCADGTQEFPARVPGTLEEMQRARPATEKPKP